MGRKLNSGLEGGRKEITPRVFEKAIGNHYFTSLHKYEKVIGNHIILKACICVYSYAYVCVFDLFMPHGVVLSPRPLHCGKTPSASCSLGK